MLARAELDALAELAPIPGEVDALDRSMLGKLGLQPYWTLANCRAKAAQPGGCLARIHDSPPGNTVMWRGWARLLPSVPRLSRPEIRWHPAAIRFLIIVQA